MRLLFDHGTLVLAGAPELQPGTLPGVVWDPRVALYRAPARFHTEIAAALRAQHLPFTDEVRPPRVQTGPWRDVELRPYQEAALLSWELSERRGITVLPTGAGKTRVALAALARLRVPALIMVPTRALLRQWQAQLAAVYDGPLGALGDGERDARDVCIATFESAYRHMPTVGSRFDLVVVDEVHHFGSAVRDEALEMCVAPARLGLTATPPEMIGRLGALVGPVVYHLGVGDLTGRWLADLERAVVWLPLSPEERHEYDADLKLFRDVYKPFWRAHRDATWQDFTTFASMSEQGRAALGAWRRNKRRLALTRAKRRAVGELLRRHADSRVLVFTADNQAAYTIARDHWVMPITCDIVRAERVAALDAFRRGELRALVSSRVLNEGIDVPDADTAIIVGGTLGEREYVQRVGRLLRPRPGKRALVYELVTAGTNETRRAAERGLSVASCELGIQGQ